MIKLLAAPVRAAVLAAFALGTASFAVAKLPPPADPDKAKAAAAETAAKAAWQGKLDAFQLCKSQDRVVAHVNKGAKGKPTAASACVDPGPYVSPALAAASGAAPAASAKAAAKPAAAKKS